MTGLDALWRSFIEVPNQRSDGTEELGNNKKGRGLVLGSAFILNDS